MLVIANCPVRIGGRSPKLALRPRIKQNRAVRRAAVIGLLVWIWLAPPTADAGPFKDFFRKVRRGFTEPARNSSSHRITHRPRAEETRAGGSRTRTINTSPNEGNTHSATRAPVNRRGKPNLPYGTPVPGKQGFVTS